jgi:DNA-binding transcriptional LysR family regulator
MGEAVDIRQLTYFLAVAEELNFTRAAARCHVVQSALSYQIAKLEQEYGITLFERTSRSVRMTPAGDLLLPRARQILNTVEEARSELTALSGGLIGRLKIAVIDADGAEPVVERALADFHRCHPHVDIAFQDTGSITATIEQIRVGATDLAIAGVITSDATTDLIHMTLIDEPLVAVLPPDHPLATRKRISLEELNGLGPFVDVRGESGLRQQVDAAFLQANVDRAVSFELSTSDSVMRYVELGFGSAVMPKSVAARRPKLVVVQLSDFQAKYRVSLLHRHPEPSAPTARAFLGFLREQLERLPSSPQLVRT